jgi:peptidoglycan/xylan/chitin deacetylase (PgdA/CDA1 family)
MKRPVAALLVILLLAVGLHADVKIRKVSRTPPAGIVSLNFDDGFVSAYRNGIPILDRAGLKSTLYVVTGYLGSLEYMTTEQVLVLRAKGHEIGAHTRTHPHLSTLAPRLAEQEIVGGKADLAALGVQASSFAYPYDDYNEGVETQVEQAGYRNARTSRIGFNGGVEIAPYLLRAVVVESSMTPKQVCALIDEARATRTWLILVFHRVDEDGNPYSVSHETLRTIVKYLVSKRVPVVTTSQGFELLLR